jgi:hypothetical protein
MAVSIANVAHPNQNVWEGEFLGYKAKVVDVTFDSSYDNTNGEAVTAASLGYQQIYGAIVLADAWSGSTTDLAVLIRPVINTAQTSCALRAFRYDGANAGKASLEEVANAVDLSTYTTRIVFIGS